MTRCYYGGCRPVSPPHRPSCSSSAEHAACRKRSLRAFEKANKSVKILTEKLGHQLSASFESDTFQCARHVRNTFTLSSIINLSCVCQCFSLKLQLPASSLKFVSTIAHAWGFGTLLMTYNKLRLQFFDTRGQCAIIIQHHAQNFPFQYWD